MPQTGEFHALPHVRQGPSLMPWRSSVAAVVILVGSFAIAYAIAALVR
jgi:hypothetical protein